LLLHFFSTIFRRVSTEVALRKQAGGGVRYCQAYGLRFALLGVLDEIICEIIPFSL
jgi:hypothetical protein